MNNQKGRGGRGMCPLPRFARELLNMRINHGRRQLSEFEGGGGGGGYNDLGGAGGGAPPLLPPERRFGVAL